MAAGVVQIHHQLREGFEAMSQDLSGLSDRIAALEATIVEQEAGLVALEGTVAVAVGLLEALPAQIAAASVDPTELQALQDRIAADVVQLRTDSAKVDELHDELVAAGAVPAGGIIPVEPTSEPSPAPPVPE